MSPQRPDRRRTRALGERWAARQRPVGRGAGEAGRRRLPEVALSARAPVQPLAPRLGRAVTDKRRAKWASYRRHTYRGVREASDSQTYSGGGDVQR
eukprot:5247749-Pleurochrysis_carterae.AAC.1